MFMPMVVLYEHLLEGGRCVSFDDLRLFSTHFSGGVCGLSAPVVLAFFHCLCIGDFPQLF